MDHVAILRKAKISKGDNLLGDILKGTKTIESRWYVNKISPWNTVNKGDKVYFKESGCAITAVAEVDTVLQYENLNTNLIREIVETYGNRIAPNATNKSLNEWVNTLDSKRYCILVFLKNVKSIQPFEIDKKGFGISSAWLVVGDIEKVRKCEKG